MVLGNQIEKLLFVKAIALMGLSAGATEWIIDKGIKVMGIDSWGWICHCPV